MLGKPVVEFKIVRQSVNIAPRRLQKAPEKIPSASWVGYFVQNGEKNDMSFDNMQINLDGSISGAGSDAIGDFNISGTMEGNGTFTFDKAYEGAHTVNYKGSLEGTK